MFQTNSLIFKNAIVYFVLFLVGISTISFLLLRDSSKEIIEGSEIELQHYGELIQLKFREQINAFKEDLEFLSDSPALIRYLETQSEGDLVSLDETHLAILKAKSDYSQIRFIGTDDEGLEISRVERNKDKIFIVAPDSLQAKGSRPYFQQSILLPEDSIFIGKIDLNKEYGRISLPKIPTWRVSTPIYYEGSLAGVLVINADLRKLFASIDQLVESDSKLRLVDDRGYHLAHEQDGETFLFEYNQDNRWARNYPFTLEQLKLYEKHGFNGMDNIFTTQEIELPGVDQKLYSIIKTNRSELLSNYYSWRNKNLGIIVVLAAGFFALAAYLLSRQVRKMKQITEEIQAYASNTNTQSLSFSGNDEIGELASAFNTMREKIDDQMSALKDAKTTAEQAVSDKEAFIENMSHEIRNPLQSITGISEILEQNTKDSGQKELIGSLQFNTQVLKSLVDDILDYRQIIDHKITLLPSWVDLESFLHKLRKGYSFAAVQKGVKLEVDVGSELKAKQILIDQVRMTQILQNLLSNAIKFTPNGGSVKLIISSKRTGELHLIVEDTGKGISESEISKITERYKQTETLDAVDGYGIGLHIVVLLLDLMKSELKIDSAIGQGSKFGFDLVTSIRDNVSLSQDTKGESQDYHIPHANILVVEDDPQIVALYEHHLAKVGADFQTINSLDTLKTIEKGSVQILISDFRLGDKIVAEYQQELVDLLAHESLFYLITANKPAGMSDLAKVDRIIQKPFSGSKLSAQFYSDWMKKYADEVSFDSLIEDYDAVEALYMKAIRLLSHEWVKSREILKAAFEAKDFDSFEACRHKMITSIRRLELENFERRILALKAEDFKGDNVEAIARELDMYLLHYINQINKYISERD